MRNLLIVFGNSAANFLLNGISYTIIVRHLSSGEFSEYLHIMALVPVLGVASSAYQQITSHAPTERNSSNRISYALHAGKKSFPYCILFSVGILLSSFTSARIEPITYALLLTYIPASFLISALIGILQRENRNGLWQLSSLLESVFRCFLVYVFSLYFSKGYSMYVPVLISVLVVTLLLFQLILKSSFIIHKDMVHGTYISTFKLISFTFLVQADVIFAPIYMSDEMQVKYMLTSNLVKLVFGVMYVYAQMSLADDLTNESKSKGKSRNTNLIIGAIGTITLVTFNILFQALDFFVLKLTDQRYDLDQQLCNVLLVANFIFILSIRETLINIRTKNAVITQAVCSLALFLLAGVFVPVTEIVFALMYTASAILYAFLIRKFNYSRT